MIEIVPTAELRAEWMVLATTVSLLAATKGGSGWRRLFGLGRRGGDQGSAASPAASTDPALRGTDWERAAGFFEKEGRYRDAAQLHQARGQNYEAARYYVKAGALTEAGALFERAGHFLKAAEVYAQAGDNRRAGENYRSYIEDHYGSLAMTRTPADHAGFTHYCRLAGQAFERAGLLEQAAEVLERGEHWEQAAQLHEKLGRYVKAADLFQRAGATNRAADVFARAGDRSRAAQMRGEALYKEDQKNEAAVQFLLGGDALRAAEVYEEAGNYLDAARCYEHSGAHRQAAEAYRQIGEVKRAAEMFGRCQDYEQAGVLYEASGDLLQASRMFAEGGLFYRAAVVSTKAGLSEQAIAYLQSVKPESSDYLAALVQLARHFIEQNLPGVAVEKLRKALAQKPVSAENLEVYDTFAEAYEQMGDYDKATDILKKIVAEKYGYRDTVGRLQELEKKAAEQKSRAESVPAVLRSEIGEAERYEFKEKLGAGGMGVVYRAYDRLLKRVVAYKMLMEQFMEVEEIRERFLREARSAAILNHPNIVTIYDVGVDRGRLFISMEYVEGSTYYEILDRGGPLPIPAVLHCMVGVLQALGHAHSKGVVHRDIKPSNIMLTRDRIIKITDFGLAKILRQSKDLSERASGTPLYMSPEQILGETLDYRTDIYALGGTMYHLVAGEPPFTEGEVLYHHVHTEPRPLREFRKDLPPALEAVIHRCLRKDPGKRFQKVEDVLVALRAVN